MRFSLTRVAAAAATAAFACAGLAACGADDDTLSISASATPHAEILQHLSDSGVLGDVELDVKVITGEVDGNELLSAGDVDANYFQHKPYLEDWQAENGVDNLVAVASSHIEPQGLYSAEHDSVAHIPEGAQIAVPRDVTNFARALYLLDDAGLITMSEPVDVATLATVTDADIADNPRNLRFVPIDNAQLARGLDDPAVAAAVINSNYAIEAGLNPASDAVHREPAENNPYANFLVTTAELEQDERIRAVAEALESPEAAQWLTDTFGDAVVPTHGTAK